VKKSYLAGLIIIGLLVLAGWFLTTRQTSPTANTTAASATVEMKENSFEPETLTVKKGTTVEFKNMDKVARWPASNLHPTHQIYPQFDVRKPVEKGQSWQFTFDKAGEWKYHDHLIPSIRGTIRIGE